MRTFDSLEMAFARLACDDTDMLSSSEAVRLSLAGLHGHTHRNTQPVSPQPSDFVSNMAQGQQEGVRGGGSKPAVPHEPIRQQRDMLQDKRDDDCDAEVLVPREGKALQHRACTAHRTRKNPDTSPSLLMARAGRANAEDCGETTQLPKSNAARARRTNEHRAKTCEAQTAWLRSHQACTPSGRRTG